LISQENQGGPDEAVLRERRLLAAVDQKEKELELLKAESLRAAEEVISSRLSIEELEKRVQYLSTLLKSQQRSFEDQLKQMVGMNSLL